MKRLTTNCPDNNLDAALNLFYIKDFETWVRGGGDGPDYPDIRLYDFIRKAAKILLPNLDFPMDDDGVDYAMCELLLDGPDEPTGLLALLYTSAWSYAELRGRLMQYEDTGKTPVEVSTLVKDWNDLCAIVVECGGVSRVRALAEADKDGRLVVLPCKVDDTVYILRRTFDGADVVGGTELWWTDIPQLGKTVFLTREEAENALEATKDD
jgi:hypothetical protein|nr:MAG TPA: hypothetical protein [Caudoviricetes sp.]